MKPKLHALAGVLAFACIACFWLSTLVAELFLEVRAVVWVKQAIPYAFIFFIPAMALAGASGFALGGKGSHPCLQAKRRRMPIIAINGLLILIPAALYLSAKASAGVFDLGFYRVQALELVAGAVNLGLMGLNIRDGLRLARGRTRPAPAGA